MPSTWDQATVTVPAESTATAGWMALAAWTETYVGAPHEPPAGRKDASMGVPAWKWRCPPRR